jgi:hypothetical protein
MTVWKDSSAAAVSADGLSVMVTTWLGSAPWSPDPDTVEVTAQIVTKPSRLTRLVVWMTVPRAAR